MVHGGAWTSNDRLSPAVLCRELASAGHTVFSLDFRDGRDGKHPCAVQDITAGIRCIRSRADEFGIDPARIGLVGSSSGGHLALLAAIQPDIEAHRGTAGRGRSGCGTGLGRGELRGGAVAGVGSAGTASTMRGASVGTSWLPRIAGTTATRSTCARPACSVHSRTVKRSVCRRYWSCNRARMRTCRRQ